MSPEERTLTEVDGRQLSLSNLDKVLYPDAGFTKADVISYYVHIAPCLLPHLADRPLTLKRYPDGVTGQSFYEKHATRSAPDWVRSVSVPTSTRGAAKGEMIEYVVISDLPSLVWAANLAALELHVPMWRSREDGQFGKFDLMVFDLDPGPPAGIVECCRVAGWLRQELESRDLVPLPKTSGSKGMQLYVGLDPPWPGEEARSTAQELARRLEQAHPGEVVSNMRRDLRGGKVLIDWSQNHPAKTTVAPYSLRAQPRPTVSTPLTFEEVGACEESGDEEALRFVAGDVLERAERFGDLFAPLTAAPRRSGAGDGKRRR
jgi:bifunctional non-homologous end joining protein LigD